VIEVKAADIEGIWSISAFQPWSDADLAEYLQAPKRVMASQSEPNYFPTFMRFMFKAIHHFGLDGQKRVNANVITEWFMDNRGELPIELNLAKKMATLVREFHLKKGGLEKLKKTPDS
jgi:hypothetical protein